MSEDWVVKVEGVEMSLVFLREYAPVIEFAGHGRYQSLTERYGPPPRFGSKALETTEEEALEIVYREAHETLTANGWFAGG